MLLKAYELMKNDKTCLEWLQERYQYIQIDEFQDTNYLQRDILYLLAGENGNIAVVGDDDQSIYGFRGAKPEIMLKFAEHYPNAVGQREMPAQNTPPSMQPQGYGQAPNSNSANLQQNNVRVYKKTVTVLTFPVATTEGYVAKILMDTKQWVCFFDQNTAEIVSQACNSGKTQIKMRVTPYRGGAKCLEIIE